MIYLTSLLFVTTKTFPKEQSWQWSALPKLTSIAELYEVTQYSGALLSKIYFQHTQFWLLTNQERHGNMNWKSLWTKCFFFPEQCSDTVGSDQRKKSWWFTCCLATAISLGFETQTLFETSLDSNSLTRLNTNHVTLHKSCVVIIQKWSISDVALEETAFLHSTIGCSKVKNVGNRLEVQWPKYWTLHFQWTQSVVS